MNFDGMRCVYLQLDRLRSRLLLPFPHKDFAVHGDGACYIYIKTKPLGHAVVRGNFDCFLLHSATTANIESCFQLSTLTRRDISFAILRSRTAARILDSDNAQRLPARVGIIKNGHCLFGARFRQHFHHIIAPVQCRPAHGGPGRKKKTNEYTFHTAHANHGPATNQPP